MQLLKPEEALMKSRGTFPTLDDVPNPLNGDIVQVDGNFYTYFENHWTLIGATGILMSLDEFATKDYVDTAIYDAKGYSDSNDAPQNDRLDALETGDTDYIDEQIANVVAGQLTEAQVEAIVDAAIDASDDNLATKTEVSSLDTRVATLETNTDGVRNNGAGSLYLEPDSQIVITKDINANNNTVTNILTPTRETDATTKKYVDNADGILAARIKAAEDKTIDTTRIDDLEEKTQDIERLSNGVIVFNNMVSMNNKKLGNVPTPVIDGDAANKQYVDNTVGGMDTRITTLESNVTSMRKSIVVLTSATTMSAGDLNAAIGTWLTANTTTAGYYQFTLSGNITPVENAIMKLGFSIDNTEAYSKKITLFGGFKQLVDEILLQDVWIDAGVPISVLRQIYSESGNFNPSSVLMTLRVSRY